MKGLMSKFRGNPFHYLYVKYVVCRSLFAIISEDRSKQLKKRYSVKKILCLLVLIVTASYISSDNLCWPFQNNNEVDNPALKKTVGISKANHKESQDTSNPIREKIFESTLVTEASMRDANTTQKTLTKNPEAHSVTIDNWRYFKGTSEPSDKWNSTYFDDSSWQIGTSFGYGEGKHTTLLDDMRGNYKDVYVRHQFNIADHHRVRNITFSLICDGPFIAYINSIEVIRSRKRQLGEPLDLSGFIHELDSGTNIISIVCSNDDINSDNFSFIPSFKFNEE